jgi:ring-1,2-phenylacetyl-CoA epoxidase subunit PaaB
VRVWEVFVQGKPGEAFEHVGEVEAPDPQTASLAAKEHFARRDRCSGMWVVDRADVHVAPWDAEVLSVGNRKVYRRSLGKGAEDDVLAGRL